MSNLPKIISYDLTTPTGLIKAISDYAEDNPKAAIGLGALSLLNPIMAINYAAYKTATTLLKKSEKATDGRNSVVDEQRKAAIDIIKAGKENGVSKMTVKLNQKAGVDIGGALEGYSMNFTVGTDDSMTVEVEYK